MANLNGKIGLVYITIMSLILVPLCVSAENIENVQISASNSGNIINTTSAESLGGDSNSSAFVRNVVDGAGNVYIETETEVNGNIETSQIIENVRDRGIVEVSIATSSEGNSISKSEIKVEISDIESTELDTAGIFSRFVRKIFPNESGRSEIGIKENVQIDEIKMATSSEIGKQNNFIKIYNRILNTLKSFWQ
jgi:hypothetical protein